MENEKLRKLLALWQAVEELKEIAKYSGLKGYSSNGKNALLRRLVKEGILTLDITHTYHLQMMQTSNCKIFFLLVT
jgi:hypothetical protein